MIGTLIGTGEAPGWLGQVVGQVLLIDGTRWGYGREQRNASWARSNHDICLSLRQDITALIDFNQFFHWHLAFPDVFRVPVKDEIPENEQAGWSGGFDVVLGNPPWERIKIQEKE